MVRELIHDPIFLSCKSIPYTKEDEKIAIDLMDTLKAHKSTCVGMAANMIGELKKAFEIGFIIFVPFVILDLVVANILLALGMMMLSPTIISLPFKLLIFIAVDGWGMVVNGLIQSFNG